MPDGEGRGAGQQESKVTMIDKVGVIGAGAMGNGIAHVCALAKLDVTLIDVSETQLAKAMDTIRYNMDRQVELRRDDLSGLPHLIVVGDEAGIDRCAAGGERRSKLVRERLE